MGNLSTFTDFQGQMFWSRSRHGQINIEKRVYCDVS